MKTIFSFLFILCLTQVFAQADKTYIEDDADIALKKMSARYETFKDIKANFRLIVTSPKVKPTDDERKLNDTITGSIILKKEKFKVLLPNQEIYCDGKNIWTLNVSDKETQLDLFEENEDVFSPAKLFSFYKTGYSYQMKEKRTINGKKVIVAEMSPVNRKTSYFKIDVSIDEASASLLQTKIYSKNGVRYTYEILSEQSNQNLSDNYFVYDAQKHPSFKLIDLR